MAMDEHQLFKTALATTMKELDLFFYPEELFEDSARIFLLQEECFWRLSEWGLKLWLVVVLSNWVQWDFQMQLGDFHYSMPDP